jgi:hypothetical protein
MCPPGSRRAGFEQVSPMTTPSFLVRLMHYAGLSRGTEVQPEDNMCVIFANQLRELSLQGKLRAVWLHPANELCFGHKTGVRAAISRAMGMHVGVSDYVFLTGSRGFALEAKFGKNGLTDNQKDFREWCAHADVPHRVFRSVEEGINALREWGLINEPA